MNGHVDPEQGSGAYATDAPYASKVYGGVVEQTDSETGQVLYPTKTTRRGLRLRSWIKKVGAEENGIERIPEELRTDQNPRDLFTLWTSANVGTATMAFGTLGPAIFSLGWWDSFCCLLFFNLIGALPPALMATLGPKLGLRTMTVQRYSFGWWPAKFFAVINLLNQIGWGMVNTIAGADILYDVGGGRLPASVAVLIIGLVALTVGLFGYGLVHKYERVSWIVMLVCLIIVAGFGAKHFVNSPMGTGPNEISGVLGFGTAIIGFQIAWAPIAADYAVYMRSNTKPWKIFL
ncbi:hypothetical protein LTR28_011779 [Elasticomyces elasticus]|nr:hypothetical protein LTR28_011779 [Elasticomyces elasticus]